VGDTPLVVARPPAQATAKAPRASWWSDAVSHSPARWWKSKYLTSIDEPGRFWLESAPGPKPAVLATESHFRFAPQSRHL